MINPHAHSVQDAPRSAWRRDGTGKVLSAASPEELAGLLEEQED
jgi:hypothetical protein